jgi:hypothetical protein
MRQEAMSELSELSESLAVENSDKPRQSSENSSTYMVTIVSELSESLGDWNPDKARDG